MRKNKKADCKPTYLYDFMQAIAPLQGKNVPPMVETPQCTLHFGCTHRSVAEKYADDLPPEGEYFQLCTPMNDLQSMYWIDVSRQVAYMQSIQVEDFVVPNGKGGGSLTRFYAAMFEAVDLFGLLCCVENEDLLAVKGGIAYYNTLYMADSVDELPIYMEYGNNPLNFAVFMAQLRFFFAKYFECAFSEIETQSLHDSGFGEFRDIMYAQLVKYQTHAGWRAESVTGVENRVFDLFTLQLETMLERESEEEQLKQEEENSRPACDLLLEEDPDLELKERDPTAYFRDVAHCPFVPPADWTEDAED